MVFDKAWVCMPVPKLNKVTGTWACFHQWCTGYDERLVPMTITGYILTHNKPRYTDPDFEKDLSTACTTGQ